MLFSIWGFIYLAKIHMPKTKKVSEKKTAIAKVDTSKSVWVHSLFTDYDIDLFLVGKHFRLYEKLGSHLINVEKNKWNLFRGLGPQCH